MSFRIGLRKLSEVQRNRIANYIDAYYKEKKTAASDSIGQHPCRQQMPAPKSRVVKQISSPATVDELRPCAPMATFQAMSLEDMLRQADAGFSETLLKLIDKTGKKDSEIYKKANISKQHFSKIRNNPDYKPTKPTAIALALALELSMEDTKDLIGRAGYALTNSSKFDLIIRYFIEQGDYNVTQINIALYEFDQPLLGA